MQDFSQPVFLFNTLGNTREKTKGLKSQTSPHLRVRRAESAFSIVPPTYGSGTEVPVHGSPPLMGQGGWTYCNSTQMQHSFFELRELGHAKL